MLELFAVLVIAVMGAAYLLNILSLPGNWIIIALALLWMLLAPSPDMTWSFIGLSVVLGLAGEGLEFWGQAYGAKRYGASGRGNLGGLIGAIVGAIVAAPFLLGIGALFGALVGAFAGCFIFERLSGRDMQQSLHASKGAFWGKMFGMSVKLALGATILVMAARRIWP